MRCLIKPPGIIHNSLPGSCHDLIIKMVTTSAVATATMRLVVPLSTQAQWRIVDDEFFFLLELFSYCVVLIVVT